MKKRPAEQNPQLPAIYEFPDPNPSFLFEDVPPTVEQLQAQINELNRKNAELAAAGADAAKTKAQLEELQKKAKEEAEKALAGNKNWEELAALKSKETEALQAQVEQLTQGIINSEVEREIMNEAVAAGVDPNAKDILVGLPRTGVTTELVLGQDGSKKVQVKGAKEFVAATAIAKPFLFKAKTPGTVGAKPGSATPPTSGNPAPTPGQETQMQQIMRLRGSKDPKEKAEGDRLYQAMLSSIKLEEEPPAPQA